MAGKDKPKDKGGRPKIEFDLKQVEGLAGIQATHEEMALVLDCSMRTIANYMEDEEGSFCIAYKRGKGKGKTSLRRLQWAAAQGMNYIAWLCDKKQAVSTEYLCEERKARKTPPRECIGCHGAREKTVTIFKAGATGMQIWLGKQWLGQTDKNETIPTDPNNDIEHYNEFRKKHDKK